MRHERSEQAITRALAALNRVVESRPVQPDDFSMPDPVAKWRACRLEAKARHAESNESERQRERDWVLDQIGNGLNTLAEIIGGETGDIERKLRNEIETLREQVGALTAQVSVLQGIIKASNVAPMRGKNHDAAAA